MKVFKILFVLVLIPSLLFLGCRNNSAGKEVKGNQKTDKQIETETTVRIGCNLPLTGNLATYGEAVRDGVNLALDDIKTDNKSKKILLDFDWDDNGSQAKQAVDIMQQQFNIGEKPDIYISGVKPQTMSIIDKVSEDKIPHFVWIFDAFVCEKYPNTFRTWVSYKQEPQYYLDYAKQRNAKKVAIVYVKVPHTDEEFNEIVIPGLKKMGIAEKNILVDSYSWDRSDFKDIATKVDAFDPELIILNGFKGNLISLVKSLRERKLIENGNTICTYDLLDAAEELDSKLLEGLRVIAPIFDTRPNNDNLKNWKENFKTKYNRNPRYTDAYAYDMAHIIFNAAGRLNLPATNEEWEKAILETNTEGITGPLNFEPSGDLAISIERGIYLKGELLPDTLLNQ